MGEGRGEDGGDEGEGCEEEEVRTYVKWTQRIDGRASGVCRIKEGICGVGTHTKKQKRKEGVKKQKG